MEQESSCQRAPITPDGPTTGQKWLFFMLGSRDGVGPWDEAYQRTRDERELLLEARQVSEELLSPRGPQRVEREEHRICALCPLRDECVLGHAKGEEL